MSDTKPGTTGYVADRIIPPSAPPPSVAGPTAWLRANLFSTLGNSIATLVCLAIVVWLTYGMIDWAVIKGVISPDDMSRRGCFAQNQASELFRMAREQGISGIDSIRLLPTLEQVSVLSERLGVDVRDITIHYGACWAVIEERFLQFTFGFYPSDQYWRPILMFLLLGVALAPVLATALPRKMLWFSAIYPVVAYFLIWGGSIWGPVLVVLGPVLGYVIYRVLSEAVSPLAGIFASVAAVLLWYLFAVGPIEGLLVDAMGDPGPLGLEKVESPQIGGFLLTVIIGVVGIVASFPIGIVLALGRKSNLPIVRTICVMFIEFIRGVPLITLLFVANVLLAYFLPPGTEFDKLLRVLIMVTLFSSAYMAEVIRGGLAALEQGQYEAANALGLNYWQSTRLIILPQALKVSIPGIVNSFIGLFKDTTLVSIIGLLDPIGIIQPIRADAAWTGIYWEVYVFVAVFFFICCFGMSRYSMHLERKLATDRR